MYILDDKVACAAQFCKLGDASGLVLSGPHIKRFHRTFNCLFYRLLRALIGGQVNKKASSSNVITEFPEATLVEAFHDIDMHCLTGIIDTPGALLPVKSTLGSRSLVLI